MIKEKVVVNYLYYHVEEDGVYFDRLNIIQNIKCTTRNSGQYDSNIMFDMYTNSKTITIDYKIMDSEVENYEFQFGLLVNREKRNVPLKRVNKGEHYIETFTITNKDNDYNRVTLVFPTGFCVAIKSIKIENNKVFKAVKKDYEVVFLGDSITEGSECFNPASTYFSKVTLYYNFIGYDFAVSGRTFNDYNLLGTYNINPKYVFIANGTNSFAMGIGNKEKAFEELTKNMEIVINSINNYFPKAKIIALLPIWRSDEKGVDYSLKDITNKMIEIYKKHNNIIIIDAHEYIPYDASYFSNATLALHPNSKGHELYGKINRLAGGSLIFEKRAFPSSQMCFYLRGCDYTEITLVGVVTHLCVLANAIMAKAALPFAHIIIDAKGCASNDEKLEKEAFDVAKAMLIEVKNN